jgi:hypothetical protein
VWHYRASTFFQKAAASSTVSIVHRKGGESVPNLKYGPASGSRTEVARCMIQKRKAFVKGNFVLHLFAAGHFSQVFQAHPPINEALRIQ